MAKTKRKKVEPMTVIVAVRMPAELYNRLCTQRDNEWIGRPISQIIREAIGDYLNKKGVKK